MIRTAKHRLVANVFANGFGQGVAILSQLVIVPVAIRWWGVTQYGEWLTLSAVPAVLNWAEFGLASATCNRVCLLAAGGQTCEAQLLLSHLLGWLARVSAVLGAIWLIGAPFIATWYGGRFTTVSGTDLKLTLAVLGLNLVLAIFQGGLQVTFRANGKNHQGILLWNFHRLAELLLTLLIVATGNPILWVASAQFALRIVVVIVGWRLSSRGADLLKNSIGRARWIWLKQDAPQAMGFVGMTMTNSLQFSITTLLVGSICGPAVLVAFSTIRSLTRVPLQIGNILTNSVMPEVTVARGLCNRERLNRMFRACCSQAFLFATGSIFLGPFIAPFVLKWWTSSHVSGSFIVLVLAFLTCAASQMGGAFVSFICATNEHVRYSMISLGIYVVACIALSLLLPKYALVAAFSLLLLAELGSAICGMFEVRRYYQFGWLQMLPALEFQPSYQGSGREMPNTLPKRCATGGGRRYGLDGSAASGGGGDRGRDVSGRDGNTGLRAA